MRLLPYSRCPGEIGRTAECGSSVPVDLPHYVLRWADIEVPETMVGFDQGPVWRGDAEKARDHIVVENRHEPTTIHLKTYVRAIQMTSLFSADLWRVI